MKSLKLTTIARIIREELAADKAAKDAKKIAYEKEIDALEKRKQELNLSEEEINEMARVPIKYAKGSVDINDAEGFSPREKEKLQAILDFTKTNGPTSIINLANDLFNTRQQAINPLVLKAAAAGILEPAEDSKDRYSKKQATYYGPESTFKRSRGVSDDEDDDTPTNKKLSKTSDAADFFVGGSFDDEEMISGVGSSKEEEPSDEEIAQIEKSTNYSQSSAKQQASEFFLDDANDRLLNKIIAAYKDSKLRIRETHNDGGLSSSDFRKGELNRKDKAISEIDMLIGQYVAKINSIADPEVRKEVLSILAKKLDYINAGGLAKKISKEVGGLEDASSNANIPSFADDILDDEDDDLDNELYERLKRRAGITK